MEDRFKFRGKRLDNNQWVYGFLSFVYVNGKNENGLIYTDKARIYCPDDCCSYDVDFKTVSQCTGLKDKNGKLIYEGDILQLWDNSLVKIEYWNSLGFFDFEPPEKGSVRDYLEKKKYWTNLANISTCWHIVIGNIYENPEHLN